MNDLRLAGWSRSIGRDDSEIPNLYTIDGLPKGDNCFVACAGMAEDGKDKWYVHWYRSGDHLAGPTGAYNSPEEALQAFKNFQQSQGAP
jgi:hypothetical protein